MSASVRSTSRQKARRAVRWMRSRQLSAGGSPVRRRMRASLAAQPRSVARVPSEDESSHRSTRWSENCSPSCPTKNRLVSAYAPKLRAHPTKSTCACTGIGAGAGGVSEGYVRRTCRHAGHGLSNGCRFMASEHRIGWKSPIRGPHVTAFTKSDAIVTAAPGARVSQLGRLLWMSVKPPVGVHDPS